MNATKDQYTVFFGSVPRTIVYRDPVGELLFTFDFPLNDLSASPDDLILETSPTETMLPDEIVRYEVAFERIVEFLTASGKRVMIWNWMKRRAEPILAKREE